MHDAETVLHLFSPRANKKEELITTTTITCQGDPHEQMLQYTTDSVCQARAAGGCEICRLVSVMLR